MPAFRAHGQGPAIRPRNETKSPPVPPADPFEAHEFVQRVLKEVEKHLANLRFAATDDHLGICRTARQILCARKPTTAKAKHAHCSVEHSRESCEVASTTRLSVLCMSMSIKHHRRCAPGRRIHMPRPLSLTTSRVTRVSLLAVIHSSSIFTMRFVEPEVLDWVKTRGKTPSSLIDHRHTPVSIGPQPRTP